MNVHPTKNVSIGIDPYPFGIPHVLDVARFVKEGLFP
jgi:hypothetical protein